MKIHKIIGVDLDEILAELLDFVLEYNNYKIGDLAIKREDVKDYYIHRLPNLGISIEKAISWYRTPIYFDFKLCEIKPVIGSLEKISKFKKDGYRLIIVTARIQELFGEYTEKWIDKYFPGVFDEIIYTDHFSDKHRNKSEICKELGISYMIEDNLDYALELAENGITTYLFEKPWNSYRKETHDNIIRIKSWEDLNI